jgi:hypothetical protein
LSDNNENEYFFDLTSLAPLSKSIWESFDDNLDKLSLNNMTQTQLEECISIKELVSCLLYKEFQCKTKFYSIQKRKTNGYSCYLVMFTCTNYLCSSTWAILVDVDNRVAYVYPSRLCQHKALNEKLSNNIEKKKKINVFYFNF